MGTRSAYVLFISLVREREEIENCWERSLQKALWFVFHLALISGWAQNAESDEDQKRMET